MLWLRQRWGQTTSSPDSPLKTSYECPPHSLVAASVTHILAFSLHELLDHSDWSALMDKLSPPSLSLTAPLARDWDCRLTHGSLWSVHTRPATPQHCWQERLSEGPWESLSSKKCFAHTSPLSCFKTTYFFSYSSCGAWIKTHILTIYQDVFYT